MRQISITHNLSLTLLLTITLSLIVSVGQPSAYMQRRSRPDSTQKTTQPVRKKNPPPGARGFEQFADRDASEKLVIGAATRGDITEYAVTAYNRGLNLYQDGRYEPARKSFLEAVKLVPAWDEAHYRLGVTFARLGDHRAAADEFNKATRLAAKDNIMKLWAYYSSGNSYAEMGEYELAAEAFRQASKEGPTLSKPRYNLGVIYRALDRKAEALAEFKEAVRLNPQYAEARYNLGVLSVELGDRQAAESQRAALSTLNPTLAEKLKELVSP